MRGAIVVYTYFCVLLLYAFNVMVSLCRAIFKPIKQVMSLGLKVMNISKNKTHDHRQFRVMTEKGSMTVYLVTNEDECNNAVSLIWDEVKKCKLFALGFDCEWISPQKRVPDQQPISLLQLCTPTGISCLFRLNILRCIPNSLSCLLTDDILKLGVNCNYDAKLINQNYGIRVKNYFDLRYLFMKQAGLAKLAESILGITLDKNKLIVCSDWNAELLSEKQIEYAAKDAWIAIEIFKYWSKDKTEDLIRVYTERYQNVPFKLMKNINEGTQLDKENSFSPLLSQKFARKTPLYDNCWMYAPDGQQLCSCDRGKAQWYIQKGLAELISLDPFSIKLLFEPNSRPDIDADADFYRQFKKNYCVVCGSDGPCMKHYVTPREYRKHFPINMKSHQSHDIVLTCLNCHAKSKSYMNQIKQELAELCDAPTYVPESSYFKQLRKMTSICVTLLNSGKNIPEEKRQYLEATVKDYFGLVEINNKILQKISSKKVNEQKILSHGEKVVEYYKKLDGGLMELEVLWRKQFLENLKPQFLPTAWSVNHNHKKLI